MAGGGAVYEDAHVPARDLGRVAVFAGYPVGVGVVGGLVLLILGGRAGEVNTTWFVGDMTPVVALSLLLVPYSIAGGILEGVYGKRIPGLPCCTLVIAGTATAYALPLFMARLAGLYSVDSSLLVWMAVGVFLQVLVAVSAWSVVRMRLKA